MELSERAKEKKRLKEEATTKMKKWKEKRKSALLDIREKSGWKARHLRMGVDEEGHDTGHGLTALFKRLDPYTIVVRLAFCSPEDNFDKTHGWLEAYANKEYFLNYNVGDTLDSVILNFLSKMTMMRMRCELECMEKNDDAALTAWEKHFNIPRWLQTDMVTLMLKYKDEHKNVMDKLLTNIMHDLMTKKN